MIPLALIIPVSRALAAPPAAGATRVQPGRPLAATDIDLDVSPAARILSLWKLGGRTGLGDSRSRAEARSIAGALAYRTMRQFLKDQFHCVTNEAQLALAIQTPDSGACGFGMVPAFVERDSIGALVWEIVTRRGTLSASIAAEVAAYLPAARSWSKVRVWFVVGSQTMFDAATLGTSADGDSVPVVLVNLTDVLSYGPDTRERMNALAHVLSHEVFHAGLHQVESRLPGWAAYGFTPKSDYAHVREVMLDEGMAHYIDWRSRPGADSMFTWKPGARENYAFAQLAIACRRLKQPGTSRSLKVETLQLAGNGPLWSKYGAISGMFAAHRIEMALGRAALRRAIEEGPDEFLRVYADLAKRHPLLNQIPPELMYSH